MKKIAAFGIVLITVFSACSSVESWFPSRDAWRPGNGMDVKGAVSAGEVRADTVSIRESLEREILGILPLFLSEKGYAFTENGEEADYTADVFVIEREYTEGWQMKRSLSAEVRIWGKRENVPPLAAGRAVLSGGKSFASSKVTARLLRIALSEALSALEKR